jgi:Fe-S-cluster containining protein
LRRSSLSSLTFDLRREDPFSFDCGACGRCCSGKVILVGPHEILGMSRVLGIGTTEFLSLYTESGGTALRTVDDGRCVFVDGSRCRVHARRPLVCRLYPLGRTTDEKQEERFALMPLRADCQAVAGKDGTIASFLESQGVAPHLVWARRYGDLYRRMIGLLERLEPEGDPETPTASSGHGPEALPAPTQSTSWQDIDASLEEYCGAKGSTPPQDIDDAIALHLRAMEEWLDDLESRMGPA